MQSWPLVVGFTIKKRNNVRDADEGTEDHDLRAAVTSESGAVCGDGPERGILSAKSIPGPPTGLKQVSPATEVSKLQ